MAADFLQKFTGALNDDFVIGGGKMARIESDQMRTVGLNGGDKNRQVFGVGLPNESGQISCFGVGDNGEAAFGQQAKFGQSVGQFVGQITFDFGYHLG